MMDNSKVTPQLPPTAVTTVPSATVASKVFVPETAKLNLAPQMPAVRPRAFYVASQWHIVPAEGVDMIDASNNNTGDKFSGTIADFNAMLKG